MMSFSDREDHSLLGSAGKKNKRRRRKRNEVFITKHVAEIIQREQFILKLTRAMMMFGGPSHRLQYQIQSAARVLDINLSLLYLPDVALISFDDAATGTSHIKLIRQPSSLDLDKLTSAFRLYWRGFIVLTASLELMSRNVVSGSVRLCYALVYALFLGFGFTMGAQLFQILTGHQIVGSEDYVCSAAHDPNGAWYQRTPSKLWVPMFSTFLSLKNQASWNSREFPVLIGIACIGWVTNHFTGLKFTGQSDIIAAVGAFAVGIIANLYAKVFSGNAFVVMVSVS
ncbi:hypothetical protein EST38_g2083 [Candolleomyces aberdarensis]|uniref:Threonine/serine exporter-like N-terminal domain-containing protein n=1 Tax=Candolleomyces aberdarensis TaxID=2316362 RepID=A0A4Q2DWG4_9AGAR|nr:hypothetical protein EST38_g2083 [Candolleomyces aberdarensis]